MCGIAGILSATRLENDPAGKMIRFLHHRGPDDNGVMAFEDKAPFALLGNTRLAIIDLSQAGHQPMLDAQRQKAIVLNGEIYNHRQLRDELPGPWASHSDTEVLLRAYGAWGAAAFPKLRGMFAAAIWDSAAQTLCLARDPYGIKPIYYYCSNDVFLFASEVRALLDSGLVPRKISSQGLRSYLRFGSLQEPLTLIDAVRSVRPGHTMTIKRDATGWITDESSYGETHSGPSPQKRADAVLEIRRRLEDSVRMHLVSDVPVAAFLSGGVDSSAIVALMARASNEKPHTFTVTFSESKFNEQNFARSVADAFGTVHREITLSEAELLQMLPDALGAMDQPTMDGINTYVVSRAVRNARVKVALSGLGGDELFAGYPSFGRSQFGSRLAKIPKGARKGLSRAGRQLFSNSVSGRKAMALLDHAGSAWQTYSISRELFSPEECETLLLDAPIGNDEVPEIAGDDAINAISQFELRGYMTNTLLRDTDQMSMAHSLEVRVPFLDSAVTPFVLGLPGEWKIEKGRSKPLLLDALGDLIPEEIRKREKMGFTLPFERWMQSSLRAAIDSELESPESNKIGLTESAREVWRRFQSHPAQERWSRSWALYVLRKWCELNGVSG